MDSQAEQTAGKLQHNRKSRANAFRFSFLSGLVNFKRWGLRKRFLLTSGLLLTLGGFALAAFVSFTMETSMEVSIQDRLRLVDQSLKDQLHTEREVLLTTVTFVSSAPEVIHAMAGQDRDQLKTFILPFVERIRVATGNTSLYFHFHIPPATSFLRTWNINRYGDDLSYREMVVKANRDQASLTGVEIGQGGPVIRSITPIINDGRHIGSVEAAVNIVETLQNLNLPQDYGITVLLKESYKSTWEHPISTPVADQWLIIKSLGDSDSQLAVKILEAKTSIGRLGAFFFRRVQLNDFKGDAIGEFILSYNGSNEMRANNARVSQCIWLFVIGATALWITLYWNVRRVKVFLDKLRKILIASQSNDFADRFQSDPIHCLDVLHCSNTECPVYRNPSLACYLETGSEAISPTMRNTCIFIAKYITCDACPVYHYRNGDEIADLSNVINTMMRIWGLFLGRVGTLLAEVLRNQNRPWHLPSLDQVSEYLEQMAKLTAFSHDLQGVYSREEVYTHLSFVFENHFALTDFALLEVSNSENQMEVAIQRTGSDLVMSHEVMLNGDLCRAKRVGEEVCSFPNPVLCQHFNCDHSKYIRCCLPMVMGSKVGAVFSFIVPKDEWDSMRKQLVMLRRFLDETAPMLSSLRLLQVTKDQSLRDPMTQCFNRRFMDAYIAQYEPLAQRDGQSIGFVMADMDHFKQINDHYGHQAGDYILQQTAQLIHESVRRSDLVIRYGGEEFLVLLMNVEPGVTENVAEKIRQSIESYDFELQNGTRLKKTISLGVAEFPRDGDTMFKVLKYSDMALYTAKNEGRNRVVSFHPGIWLEER